MTSFSSVFPVPLTKCHIIVGDWEREDAGFRHSYYRAAPEERGKAKEDAGEDETILVVICVSFPPGTSTFTVELLNLTHAESVEALNVVFCRLAPW